MRRAHRSLLPVVAILAALVVLPTFAADTNAATSQWLSKCSVRLRTSPSTGASTKRIVPSGTVATVSAEIKAGSWSADCAGRTAGTIWLKITAINGRSTSSLYGSSAVYAAKGLFKVRTTATSTSATTTHFLTNCSVRMRASASTSASTRSIVPSGTNVTVVATVRGGSWSASCGGSTAGTVWYKITAVNGQSTSSLYGASAVYAAKGLFRLAGSSSGGTFLNGIDVSHWQGFIDWKRVRASGRRFAFAKATEGISVTDSRYTQNKAGAMANGVAFGAYHFAQPKNDPIREADWFVNHAGYRHGMLIPVLDLERTGGRSVASLQWWVRAWLGRVRSRLGVKAAIYTSPGFWRSNMGNTSWFANNGYPSLWVAHWGTSTPSIPGSNWGGRSWTFWQVSETGRVPGISTYVDLDYFRFSSLAAVTY